MTTGLALCCAVCYNELMRYIKTVKTILKRFVRSPYCWLLIIGLLASMPLWHYGVPDGNDSLFHLYRYQSTTNAWLDGQIIPQVDPNALGGFGYSWNIFYGPLPTYIVAFFNLFTSGHGAVGANIFTAICLIASGLAFYKMTRELWGKSHVIPSFLASLAFMLANYHLMDMFIRQAHGEFLPFVLAPLLVIGLHRLVKHRPRAILYIAIPAAGMILSHNLSAVIWAVISIVYLGINWRELFGKQKTGKTILQVIGAGVFTLGLAAFFILPFLEAKNSTEYNIFNEHYSDVVAGQSLRGMGDHAISPGDLFYPPTLHDRANEWIDFTPGLLCLISIPLYFIFRKKIPFEAKRFIFPFLILSFFAMWFSTPLFPWRSLPDAFSFLAVFQFPWRIMTIASFGLSLTLGFSLYYAFEEFYIKRRELMISLSALAIFLVAMPLLMHGNNSDWLESQKVIDYSLDVDEWKMRLHWPDQYVPSATNRCATDCTEWWQAATYLADALKDRGRDVIVLPDGRYEHPLIYYPGYEADNGAEVTVSPNGFVATDRPADLHYGLSRASKLGLVITGGGLIAIPIYLAISRRSVKR